MDEEKGFIFDKIGIPKLSKKYETPFYLISENKIRENYKRFVNSFKVKNKNMYYSVKTNFESCVLKTLKSMGAGVEVFGKEDLLLVLSLGFNPKSIIMDGPYRPDQDLALAIKKGVHLIKVESLDEIEKINGLSKKQNKIANLSLRINVPISNYGHLLNRLDKLRQKDFGFDTKCIQSAIKKISACKNVSLIGLSSHITTIVTKPQYYKEMLKLLFCTANKLKEHNIEIKEVNLGGGYPSKGIQKFGQVMSNAYFKECEKYNIRPALVLEPGKSIVNNTTILVGKIVSIKGKQVLTDMSINDLGHKSIFKKRKFVIANKTKEKLTQRVNIVSSTLNPYDVLFLNAKTPRIEKGDTLVIFDVGAYSIPLSTQFMRPRNAVYFKTSSGKIILTRRKENYKDLIQTQVKKKI